MGEILFMCLPPGRNPWCVAGQDPCQVMRVFIRVCWALLIDRTVSKLVLQI
jgi:hypothetical protein